MSDRIRRGRPPKGSAPPTRERPRKVVSLNMDVDLLAAVDRYTTSHAEGNRSEAMARLIQLGLRHERQAALAAVAAAV